MKVFCASVSDLDDSEGFPQEIIPKKIKGSMMYFIRKSIFLIIMTDDR
jgi:hypothetical protein